MNHSTFKKMAGRWQNTPLWSRVRKSRFYRATSTVPIEYSDESRNISYMYGVGRGGFPRGGGRGHCCGGQGGRRRGNHW